MNCACANKRRSGFGYVIRRVINGCVWPISLLVGLCVLTFFLSYVAPGDPARIILGPNAHEDAVRELHVSMGFDRPLIVQFGHFMGEITTGHWGVSWISRQPVLREIGDHLRPTLALGIFASVYSIALAVFLNGIVFRFPRVGRPLISFLRLGISLPGFVIAVACALAVTRLHFWSANSSEMGGDSILAYAVPAIAVALYPACVMTTLLRDRFSNILESSFFRAARASGFSPRSLFARVLLANSWATLFTAWVNQISLLVFSTIIVEYVFSFRGLGTLLMRSIQGKDLPVLSGIILLNGFFFLLVRTLSENTTRGIFDTAVNLLEPKLPMRADGRQCQ